MATGHSARDVYRYLAEAKIEIEAKGIAVGVRLEHPSQLIDQIQYHSKQGRGRWLPAAEYAMVTQVEGRGVYSFCMCPGGFVIPAATDKEQIVVNGMSPVEGDEVPRRTGKDLLATRQYEADGASPEDAGLCEWQTELRPAQVIVCPRTDFESIAFLVAQDDFPSSSRGI